MWRVNRDELTESRPEWICHFKSVVLEMFITLGGVVDQKYQACRVYYSVNRF